MPTLRSVFDRPPFRALLALFRPPARPPKNLLEEVADLTSLLEDEAVRKADNERRSRQNGVRGSRSSCVGGSNGGPIPSSELRRFGKKLEEAVRSREHAAEVTQRLATDRKVPRKRVSSRPTVPPVVAGKEDGGRKSWASPTTRGGGNGEGRGVDRSVRRSDRSRPSRTSALPGRAASELDNLPSRGDPMVVPKTLAARARSSGIDPAEEELEGGTAAAAATGQATRQSGGVSGRERGVLASKLRGAVRLSREEKVLDDERFLS